MTFGQDFDPEFAHLVESAQNEMGAMMAFWTKEQVAAFVGGTKVVGATSEELEFLSAQAMASGDIARAIGLGVGALTVAMIEEETERLAEPSDYHPVDRPIFGRKEHG